MSTIVWGVEELREMVRVSSEIYEKTEKLGERLGRRLYEGLMITLDLKGSSEVAAKYLEIQYRSATPLVLLEDETWSVNKDLLNYLLKSVDPNAPVEEIVKEGEAIPSKHVGRVRMKLGGAWGEIIAFYILNEPAPRITTILYLLHMATYVTSFITVTIPEVYTGSEEFLKLVSNVDDKRGALEFLTRLMRRRYISEDLYAKALEAVNRRHDLTFTSLKEELERREARALMADYVVHGISGIIVKLDSLLKQYKDGEVPRDAIASIVGDMYIVTRGLKEVLDEYDKALNILNDLLTTSGKSVSSDRIRRTIERLSKTK